MKKNSENLTLLSSSWKPFAQRWPKKRSQVKKEVKEEHFSRGETKFEGCEVEKEPEPCGWKIKTRKGDGLGEVSKGRNKQDGIRRSQ